jgi:hypothetical protein
VREPGVIYLSAVLVASVLKGPAAGVTHGSNAKEPDTREPGTIDPSAVLVISVPEGPATGVTQYSHAEELDVREPGPIHPSVISVASAGTGTSEPCDRNSNKGNNPCIKASFGLRSSHNEELCVASCGCIVGRKTFVGSELPTNVLVRPHHIMLCHCQPC